MKPCHGSSDIVKTEDLFVQSEHGNRLDTKIMKRPYAPDHIRFTTGLIRLPTASNSIQQHPTASDRSHGDRQPSPAITSNRPPPDLHPSDVEAVCIDCHNPKSAAASPSRCLSSKNPGVLQRQHFCTSAL